MRGADCAADRSGYAQVIPFDIPLVLTTFRSGHCQFCKPAHPAGTSVFLSAAHPQRCALPHARCTNTHRICAPAVAVSRSAQWPRRRPLGVACNAAGMDVGCRLPLGLRSRRGLHSSGLRSCSARGAQSTCPCAGGQSVECGVISFARGGAVPLGGIH